MPSDYALCTYDATPALRMCDIAANSPNEFAGKEMFYIIYQAYCVPVSQGISRDLMVCFFLGPKRSANICKVC